MVPGDKEQSHLRETVMLVSEGQNNHPPLDQEPQTHCIPSTLGQRALSCLLCFIEVIELQLIKPDVCHWSGTVWGREINSASRDQILSSP